MNQRISGRIVPSRLQPLVIKERSDKDMSVYTLGPKGSYSEIATIRYLKDMGIQAKVELLIPLNKSEGVIERMVKDYGDGKQNVMGVVPIYNTIVGRVKDTIGPDRGLVKYPLVQIVDEYVLEIQHCLASKPSSIQIKKVISHEQAIAQCVNHMRLKGYTPSPTARSTAEAAKIVSESDEDDIAAICSVEAAEYYGLKVLENEFQDLNGGVYTNRTVFVVLSFQDNSQTGKDKTTLSFELRNPAKAGSLYKVLKSFSNAEINISHHEAMEKGSLVEYVFWFNIDKHRENIQRELGDLQNLTTSMKIHGSYPRKTPP